MDANRPPAGLPHWLKLLIVEFAGIFVMAAGLRALLLGHPVLGVPLGLTLVLFGADLLLRPGSPRRLPRLDRLLLTLVHRWRSPPAAPPSS